MKIFPLFLGLALAAAPVTAQVAVENLAPLPAAPKMATVTPFLTGLKEPQGLALDDEENLLVCDYGAGEILKYSRDGKLLGKLATGLNGPTQIVVAREPGQFKDSIFPVVYVAERKANRVISINRDGTLKPLGNAIAEPLGLVFGPSGLAVISHTTSQVYRWRNPSSKSYMGRSPKSEGKWELFYSTPTSGGNRYGFRCLEGEGRAYLLSDEVGEKILMLTESGKVATFASGISDPSGIAIGPDKMVYVANEGDGGQLIRLNSEGEKTVVAEKLGRPRGILFLDAKTALVSNRDGNIWKVVLP